MTALVCAALAVLAECCSLVLYLTSVPASGPLLLAIAGLHLIACTAVVIALAVSLPADYQRVRWQITAAFLPLVLFIPVFGLCGALCSLLPALRHPLQREQSFAQRTAVPDLPFKPVEIDATFSFAGGGLYEVLKHSPDADRRAKAVLATQRMDERKAIPVLQIALKDPVDDVRLLAYSILDQKENRINIDIKQALTELENCEDTQQSLALHKQLASLYWELVYLGLAQGDVLQHILKTTTEHLITVLNRDADDAGANFLLGRVLVREGKYAAAEQALNRAVDAGMDRSSITPYLAEIAFLSTDYARIPALLHTLPESERRRRPISPVAEYWQAA